MLTDAAEDEWDAEEGSFAEHAPCVSGGGEEKETCEEARCGYGGIVVVEKVSVE